MKKENGYVPATVFSPSDLGKGIADENMWWTKGGYYYYPKFLVTAYDGIKDPNYRQNMKISDEVFVMGDSGGFQNISRGAECSPLKVLEWQENNCDVGFTLDFPISADTSKIVLEKQEKTVENAFLALDNKHNDNFQLYAVLQGKTRIELERIMSMYEEKGGLNKFDGVGIGGIAVGIKAEEMVIRLAEVFDILKDFDMPVHLFGLSSLNHVPTVEYLKRVYKKEFVTYDSTTYGLGRREYSYFNPFTFKKITFEKDRERTHTLNKFPCFCPVCRDYKTIDNLPKSATLYGIVLSLHNLYHMINYTTTCQNLIDDLPLFKAFLKGFNREISLKSIDYIDLFLKDKEKFRVNLKRMNESEKSLERFFQ